MGEKYQIAPNMGKKKRKYYITCPNKKEHEEELRVKGFEIYPHVGFLTSIYLTILKLNLDLTKNLF